MEFYNAYPGYIPWPLFEPTTLFALFSQVMKIVLASFMVLAAGELARSLVGFMNLPSSFDRDD